MQPPKATNSTIAIQAKAIQADVAEMNRNAGGSHRVYHAGFVPGMEPGPGEEGVREVAYIMIDLAAATVQDGSEYILPNGVRCAIDPCGTFCKAEYAGAC